MALSRFDPVDISSSSFWRRPMRERDAAEPPAASDRLWTTLPYEALDRVAHALQDRGVTLVPTLVRQEAHLRSAAASCDDAPPRPCAQASGAG